MFSTKKILIGNWFMKVARGDINDEMLLITTRESAFFMSVQNSINSIMEGVPKQYSTPYPYSLKYTKTYTKTYTPTESEKKVLSYQYVSTYGYTIYLMDSHNINIINEIKNYKNKNKNIIIVTLILQGQCYIFILMMRLRVKVSLFIHSMYAICNISLVLI